jgi:hypothetical protein
MIGCTGKDEPARARRMKLRRRRLPRLIRVFELSGFFFVIIVIWLDEILDLPHVLFGAPATPINCVESIFETAFVALLAALVVSITSLLMYRIMGGILTICTFCKRIRADGRWISLDDYIPRHSNADLSHGICPECFERHCDELMDTEGSKKD